MKEKSICFSSGLKVADSAAPENFLSVPSPMTPMEAAYGEAPPIANRPPPSIAAANVSDAPLNAKRSPEPA